LLGWNCWAAIAARKQNLKASRDMKSKVFRSVPPESRLVRGTGCWRRSLRSQCQPRWRTPGTANCGSSA